MKLEPWITLWPDQLTETLNFEPRVDFLRYHGLRKQQVEGGATFRQPLEDVVVLSLTSTASRFDEISISSTVHRD